MGRKLDGQMLQLERWTMRTLRRLNRQQPPVKGCKQTFQILLKRRRDYHQQRQEELAT